MEMGCIRADGRTEMKRIVKPNYSLIPTSELKGLLTVSLKVCLLTEGTRFTDDWRSGGTGVSVPRMDGAVQCQFGYISSVLFAGVTRATCFQ